MITSERTDFDIRAHLKGACVRAVLVIHDDEHADDVPLARALLGGGGASIDLTHRTDAAME